MPSDPAAAVAAFAAAVAGLLEAEWASLPPVELCAAVAEVESGCRRLAVVGHRTVAALQSGRVAEELCVPSTAVLLAQLLRLSPGEARARVRAAQDLGPRREVCGALLPPLFAVTAAAMADGVVSADHARVIGKTIDALPDVVDKEHGAAVEATLVAQAATLDPAQLAVVAQRIRDLLDPDATLASERDYDRRRDLVLRTRRDGAGEIHGVLTPQALAVWQTVLDTLSAPAPQTDGLPDNRAPGQRCHDGFLDAGTRLLRCGDLPDVAGAPVTVLLTLTAADLATGHGAARTAHGARIRTTRALPMCGDAELVPVVFDTTGGIISYGRGQRLASRAQRRALAARDGGCCFPGCDRPPAWTEVHHVVPWRHGGPTSIANMCLLCRYHHDNFDKHGWHVTMTNGTPMWIPPAWSDPAQIPRRNTTHHPPLQFAHIDIDHPGADATDRSGRPPDLEEPRGFVGERGRAAQPRGAVTGGERIADDEPRVPAWSPA